jgi:hypothetical protein
MLREWGKLLLGKQKRLLEVDRETKFIHVKEEYFVCLIIHEIHMKRMFIPSVLLIYLCAEMNRTLPLIPYQQNLLKFPWESVTVSCLQVI